MKKAAVTPAEMFLVLFFSLLNSTILSAQKKDQMVRMSEIEIVPEYLEQYKTILKEEAEASVRLEPGVIAILKNIIKSLNAVFFLQ